MEVTCRWARRGALALACLCLLTPTASAADPKADEQVEARSRYKKGLELYEEGAFDAALIELQRAYDLSPSYKILYNVALVYLQLNDFAGSLRNFKKYLDDGGKKIDQKRRAEVEKEIAKLQSRVATVELTVNVEGAEVSVDDLDVGETPLDQPLIVNAGKRKLSVQKSGFARVTKVLVVAGGDKKKLSLTLEAGSSSASTSTSGKPERPGPSSPGKPEKPASAKDEGPKRRVPWLWWGVTGGLAAGTTVAGVLTLGAQKDLDDKKEKPATKGELDDAASKTRTLAIVTDVLLVGSVAVGGYATYLTFFAKPDDPRRDQTARWAVGVGPGNVTVAGSF
ncbi:MAG: PEGA domain-containing protein [Myxococcales bacterium]|nr:PEGA domain-containing protein [Myxococcales bacterium]